MRNKKRDYVISVTTALICAIIFALIFLHLQTVRQSYLKGLDAGLNAHSVQDVESLVNK